MPSSRNRLGPLSALLALGGLSLCAGVASGAASRIVRPVTDATAPPAATQAPTSPAASRAIPVTPGANPMRETSPGVYEGIVPIRMPDGSWLVHLDERFHAFSVVRKDGGTMSGGCVYSAAGLAHWRAALVTTPSGTTRTKWEDR